MARDSGRRLAATFLAFALLTACAVGSGDGRDRGSAQAEQPRKPQVLTLAIPREPDTWNIDLSRVTRGGGVTDVQQVGHNRLIVQTNQLQYVPELAMEMISFEKGTWRLNPDGSMDTTWTIHPNVRWHDGTAFTSDDVVFTVTVITDPEIPTVTGSARVMRSASALDPRTVTVQWSAPFVDADQAPGLTIMPRHLLEGAYRTDKANFVNHPWMTTEFVGLGPFRLTRWEPGSHLEFARFDAYYRGPPSLDRVVIRFISDDNAMIANILAGEVDVIPPVGVDLDAALQLRGRWEGTGNQVGGVLSGGLKIIEMQHRPEFARPTNGLSATPIRQAFYHAIDRSQLAEVMTRGLAPAADSWFFPSHELRRQVESAIPQFPNDAARARALLAQTGWARGADGSLAHQQSGARFQVQLASNRPDEKAVSIVADHWRALGAQVDELTVASDRERDLEYVAKLPGGWIITPRYFSLYEDRYHSKSTATAANRWIGRNRGGYSNPSSDALLDRLVATIQPAERVPLHRELLREQLGDLAVMPLYWEYDAFLVVKGVTGVDGGAWNIFQWQKE